MEHRRAGSIRVFLKLSNLKSRLDCYQRYRRPNTHKLLEGHEKCLVLDGFWKPPPMPDDLYSFTKYDNDLAWIIMSAMHTGSQLHIDPDHMGAWNLLLTGRKWWTVIPYQAKTSEFTCDRACSHKSWGDGSNSYMWFNHVLPQIRDKKFYGKNVLEFVQEPGDVLYLPTVVVVRNATLHLQYRRQRGPHGELSLPRWNTVSRQINDSECNKPLCPFVE